MQPHLLRPLVQATHHPWTETMKTMTFTSFRWMISAACRYHPGCVPSVLGPTTVNPRTSLTRNTASVRVGISVVVMEVLYATPPSIVRHLCGHFYDIGSRKCVGGV